MSTFDWQYVVNIVEKEFPTFIPVPSRDVEDYRIFNFVSQTEWSRASTGYPKFNYYGNEGDMSRWTASISKPVEVTSKKLWAFNECAIKRSKTSTDDSKDITFSLGIISEHKFSYGRLESWLQKLKDLRSEVVSLAKEHRLFIIHTVIIAEELVIKEGKEVKDKVLTAVGDERLNRPKEFGGFPIGFKVGKVLVKNIGSKEDSIYRLELEDMRYFDMAYKERWVPFTKSKQT